MANAVMTSYLQKMSTYFENIQKVESSLSATAKQLQDIQKKANNLHFNKATQSAEKLKKALQGVNKLLDLAYNKAKLMIFAGIGTIFGGFGAGQLGSQTKKNKFEAKNLNLDLRQYDSLRQTSKLIGADENLLTNILNNLNNAKNDVGSSGSFASLGLDYSKYNKKSGTDLLFSFLSDLQKSQQAKVMSNNNLGEVNSNTQSLSGIDYSTLMNLNLKQIGKEYKELYNKNLKNKDYDKLQEVGTAWERFLIKMEQLFKQIVSRSGDKIIKIFETFATSLERIGKSTGFQNLLDRFADFAKNLVVNGIPALTSFIIKLPAFINEFINFLIQIKLFFMKADKGISKFLNSFGIGYNSSYTDREILNKEKEVIRNDLGISKDVSIAEIERLQFDNKKISQNNKNLASLEAYRKANPKDAKFNDYLRQLEKNNNIKIINNISIDKDLQAKINQITELDKQIQNLGDNNNFVQQNKSMIENAKEGISNIANSVKSMLPF